MIDLETGEVKFKNSPPILPYMDVRILWDFGVRPGSEMREWNQQFETEIVRYFSAGKKSEFGAFDLEVICNPKRAVFALLFSLATSVSASECLETHRSILIQDLFGQKEHSWGWAYLENESRGRNWVFIVYKDGLHRPLGQVKPENILHEREPLK